MKYNIHIPSKYKTYTGFLEFSEALTDEERSKYKWKENDLTYYTNNMTHLENNTFINHGGLVV